jgi:hypothetical protein
MFIKLQLDMRKYYITPEEFAVNIPDYHISDGQREFLKTQDYIISCMATPEGRRQIAAAMVEPIKAALAYTAYSRIL